MSESSFVRLAQYAPDAGFDIMGGDIVVQFNGDKDNLIEALSIVSDCGATGSCRDARAHYVGGQIVLIDGLPELHDDVVIMVPSFMVGREAFETVCGKETFDYTPPENCPAIDVTRMALSSSDLVTWYVDGDNITCEWYGRPDKDQLRRVSLIDGVVSVDSYHSDEDGYWSMCTLAFDQFQWAQIEAIDSVAVDVEM